MSYFLRVDFRGQFLFPYFNAKTNAVQMVTSTAVSELDDNSPAGKGRNCRWNIHRMDPTKNIYRILPVGALADSKVLVARGIGQTVGVCPADDPSLANGGDLFEIIFSGDTWTYYIKSINTQGFLSLDPATQDTLITTTNADDRLGFLTTVAIGTGSVITNSPELAYNIKLGLRSNFLASRRIDGSRGDLLVVSNPANPTKLAKLQFAFEFVRCMDKRCYYRVYAPSTADREGPLYLSIRDDNSVVLVRRNRLTFVDSLVLSPMINDMGRFALISDPTGTPRFLCARAGLPVAALPLSQIGAEDRFHFVPCARVSSAESAPAFASHFTNGEEESDVSAIIAMDTMFAEGDADSDFSLSAPNAAASGRGKSTDGSTSVPLTSSGWMYRLGAFLLVGGVCLAALAVYSQFAGH